VSPKNRDSPEARAPRATETERTETMAAAVVITATELAAEFKTDPKTVRRFLRADYRDRGLATPGKGHQWRIERKSVASLRKRHGVWAAAEAKARAARLAAAAAEAAAALEVIDIPDEHTVEIAEGELLEITA